MTLRNSLGQVVETVIVPARHAWPEYEKYSAYICQPSRHFVPVQYIGFYYGGHIQPIIAKVKTDHPNVTLVPDLNEDVIKRLIEQIIQDRAEGRRRGQVNDIYRLSSLDDRETITLPRAIPSDKRSSSGRATAFIRKNSYFSLADLQRVASLPIAECFTSRLSTTTR